jgi:ornithine--oxo-acid transaminase
VPFGDSAAVADAIDDDTVAFLVEPVQGEAGVLIPPPGYLREVARICNDANVLLIADEIQTGLGRTGRRFACEHESVEPDIYLLGKALGGGILPLSAVVADSAVMEVLRPGEHGSTFGGNPLACAVGREVLRLVEDEEIFERSAELGRRAADRLRAIAGTAVAEVRQIGLWIAIDIDPGAGTARGICERLLEQGVLCKDTHGQTVRVAPPLTVTADELDWALERIESVLAAGPA